MRKLAAPILVSILAIAMLLSAEAANDPGHDILYIEQQGNSELNGSFNITYNTMLKGLSMIQSYLNLYANGSAPTPTYSQIAGTTSSLYIDSPGALYFNSIGAGGSSSAYFGTTGDTVNANITGNLYVQGSTATVAGKNICLADGTNCPSIGGASSAGGWTNTSTMTTTDLTVNTTAGQINYGNESFYGINIGPRFYNSTGVYRNGFYLASDASSTLTTGSLSGSTIAGSTLYSSGDIYTTGAGDDLWLGTSTQANSQFRAYASGDLFVNNSINTTQICLAGDCQTSWPSGGDGSGGWTNTSTVTSTSLAVVTSSTMNATTFYGAGTGLTGTASSLTAGAVTNGLYTTTSFNNASTSDINVSGAYNTLNLQIGLGKVTATELADGAALAEILDDDGSGSNLDADTLDGIDSSTFDTYYAAREYNTASVTAGDWYRIASVSSGTRADALFTLRDTISGGGHSTLRFIAGSNYNNAAGISFTLLSHSIYSVPTFTQVRILTNSTYSNQYLEVYANRTGTVSYTIYDNEQSGGWTPLDWDASSIPEGYTITTYSTNVLFMAANNGDDESFIVDRAGQVGIGTTSPTQKLHVAGSINVTQNITFSGGGYMYDNGTALILGHR